MNQIIIEGLDITDVHIRVKDIDDAINKLHELKASKKQQNLCSIQRFRGIVQPSESTKTSEEEWYLQ